MNGKNDNWQTLDFLPSVFFLGGGAGQREVWSLQWLQQKGFIYKQERTQWGKHKIKEPQGVNDKTGKNKNQLKVTMKWSNTDKKD